MTTTETPETIPTTPFIFSDGWGRYFLVTRKDVEGRYRRKPLGWLKKLKARYLMKPQWSNSLQGWIYN